MNKMSGDTVDKGMIDRLLSTVDWDSSETGRRIRKVERAFYAVLKRDQDPVVFIERVCKKDLFTAAACFYKIANTISGFDGSAFRKIIIDKAKANAKAENSNITGYTSGCLAAFALKEYPLIGELFLSCSSLSEIDQESILKDIADGLDIIGNSLENFIAFLSMVYINFSSAVSGKVMESFPYQLSLGNNYENIYFERLLKSVVRNRNYHALYWLSEIFTDLDFERAYIEDIEQLTGDIFKEDNYLGMLVLLKWLTKYPGSFNDGVDRLWSHLERSKGKNAAWMSFYCLSQAIIHGENADDGIDKYSPLPYYGTMDQIQLDKTAEAISQSVDYLIESRSLKAAGYLKKIHDYNIFRFPFKEADIEGVKGIKKNRHYYCSYMVESGLAAEEIVFVYMNSNLRKSYDFYLMVCQLCEGEEYRESETCNLYTLFEHYTLKGKCILVNNKLHIKLDNVYSSYYPWVNYTWIKNNRTYTASKLLEGTEVTARASCYYRSKKFFAVENVMRIENVDLSMWRAPAYERLRKLMAEVLEYKDFTEDHKVRFRKLNMVDIEECGKSAETALYILEVCCELCYDFSQVKSFLQTINRCFDGNLNKYRHIDFASSLEELPKEDYLDALPHVYKIWETLMKRNLKPEELIHIYCNTILKRVITIEKLVMACFNIPYCDQFFDISLVFKDRWYSGIMLFSVDRTLAIRPEAFNRGKALFDYYFPEGSKKAHYASRQRLFFWLKEYNPVKHEFIIGELSSHKDMQGKEPVRYFIKTVADTAEVSNENIADYKKKALSSPTVRIEPRHLPALIAKLDGAVRFRRKSVQDITDYFLMLGSNNVFSLSDKPLLELEYTLQTSERKTSYLFAILRLTTLDDGLYMYLNTYFKYYVGLDEFFGLYYKARKEINGPSVEGYNIRFRGHTIICSKGSTVNVKCTKFLVDGAPADKETDYRLIITGYEKDTGCVLFSDMDTVFENT